MFGCSQFLNSRRIFYTAIVQSLRWKYIHSACKKPRTFCHFLVRIRRFQSSYRLNSWKISCHFQTFMRHLMNLRVILQSVFCCSSVFCSVNCWNSNSCLCNSITNFSCLSSNFCCWSKLAFRNWTIVFYSILPYLCKIYDMSTKGDEQDKKQNYS